MGVCEMFMWKVIALADLKLPHTNLSEAFKKTNRLKNGLKETNAASAFKAINSGIL